MNPAEHTRLRESIADFVSGRLETGPEREVALHVAECSDCAELVAVARTLRRGAAEGGRDLQQDHLDVETLTTYALGERGSDAGIERHLATCSSCSVEVEVWREQKSAPGFGLESSSRPVGRSAFRPYQIALAAALAGLLLGAGLTGLLQDGSDSAWSGAISMTVLERPLRGDEPAVQVRIAPGQPYVLVGAAASVPQQIADDERVRFELLRADDTVAWSHELAVLELRGPLEETGVMPFLVPASVLEPGTYRARLVLRRPGADTMFDAPFEVSAP